MLAHGSLGWVRHRPRERDVGRGRTLPADMSEQAVEVVVGPDGGVAPDDLARLGVRPGDHLRLVAVRQRRPKSLLGAFPREIGFTQAHLDEVRRDMGLAVGDDLSS